MVKSLKYCAAKTKSGEPCKNYALKISKYCNVHANIVIRILNKISDSKLKIALTILGFVLTITIAIYTIHTGASKENQEFIINQLESIKDNKMTKDVVFSKSLNDSLLLRYPEGYLIVAVDKQMIFTRPQGTLSKDINFDWQYSGIIRETEKVLAIMLPTIENTRTKSVSFANALILDKDPIHRYYAYPVKDLSLDYNIVIEIIYIKDNETVFVIGFNKE
ncbi:MAG: hypothetical protein R3F48_11035 [Candidatus Zixiibacteriota bacterium]